MNEPLKKVLVSGCFDLLHSGHIAFLETATQYGEVYVCIGSDQTVLALKQRATVQTEEERKYHLQAIRYVKEVRVSRGSGVLDFLPEWDSIQPDMLLVNEDGHHPEKEKLCRQYGAEYIVLKRQPKEGLEARSTTALRSQNLIPYRIDLAGGWLDQPFVSSLHEGPVITLCIEPNAHFNLRSGMATSTRAVATELWQYKIPKPNDETTAKMLFAYENPPGKKEIAGSQDSIGIVYTGLTKSSYKGAYWPNSIENIQDSKVLTWLEEHVYLIPLKARETGFEVLSITQINEEKAKALSEAANAFWEACLAMNLELAGKAMTQSFDAQVSMFPLMSNPEIAAQIDALKHQVKGYKLSGAGGGGYLILLSEIAIPNAIKIQVKRKHHGE